MATKKQKWSLYDENGDVTEAAQKILSEVFHEYKSFSPREEQCRSMVWEQSEEGMTEKEFKQLCNDIKDFDMEEEGPLDEDNLAVFNENGAEVTGHENGGEELPDDPKILVMTVWVDLFRAEMDPFPKKKAEQVEWISMYGNFFWVAGWALMQLKEEHIDLEWTRWKELTADELLTLAGEFANYMFTEDLEPILRSAGAEILGDKEQ